MTQKELADKIVQDAGLESASQGLKVVKAVVDGIIEGLKKEGKVQIAGLGVFKVKERKARTARNPRTGEAVQVAASKKVSFRPATSLKEEFKI